MKKYVKFEDEYDRKLTLPSERKFRVSYVKESDDALFEDAYIGAFISKFEKADGKLKIEITYDYSEETLSSKN